jgi:hypothetical protein
MTKTPAALGFLLAMARAVGARLLRFVKKLAAPGSGPYLAGC